MRTRAIDVHVAVILAYTLLTAFMSWPLLPNISTHVVGEGGDPWQTLWRFENKWEAYRQAQSTFGFAESEFLGGGEPQLVNLSVWPWMWLHVLVGEPLAYNVVWFLSFVLSGYAMYLLVRWILRQQKLEVENWKLKIEASSFLAGLMYMFLPYHVAHSYGHFGAMQMQWLPAAILASLACIRRPSVWLGLALAGLLTIQAWTEHHYLLWLVLLAGLYGITHIAQLRSWVSRRATWPTVALIGSLLCIFVVIPFIPTLRLAAGEAGALELGRQQVIRFSADPFAYVLPSPLHPIWGGFVWEYFARFFTGNTSEATHFLGLMPLLLVAFFHQRAPLHTKKFWLTAAVVFFVISLGPKLHVLGRETEISLPYDLIDSAPVFSAVRTVARAGVLVALSFSVLFGLVLAAHLKRAGSAVVAGAVILAEFLFLPVPLQHAELPAAYGTISSLPGKTILEIPAATQYDIASRSLYASTVHGRTVLGNIALERGMEQEVLREARSLPAVRQLLFLRTTDLRERRPDFFHQELAETFADVVQFKAIGAVIIHPDSLSALQLASVQRFLEQEVRLEAAASEDLIVYPTTPLLAGSIPSDGVFLMRDDSWRSVSVDAARDVTRAEIPRSSSISLVNTTAHNQRVVLTFTIAPGSHGSIALMQGEQVIAESHARPGEQVRFDISLLPGKTDVQFLNRLPDPAIIENPRMHVQTVP